MILLPYPRIASSFLLPFPSFHILHERIMSEPTISTYFFLFTSVYYLQYHIFSKMATCSGLTLNCVRWFDTRTEALSNMEAYLRCHYSKVHYNPKGYYLIGLELIVTLSAGTVKYADNITGKPPVPTSVLKYDYKLNLMVRLLEQRGNLSTAHFAITPRSTLTWFGSIFEGLIYGSNRTIQSITILITI